MQRQRASHSGVHASGASSRGPCRGSHPGAPDRSAVMPASENSPPDRATEALERLGSMALRDQSMESVLQTVVDLAKQVLPGNPEASISLLSNGRPSTTSSTGQLALELDEAQYGRGYGPCLHAAATGELTEILDTATE